LNLLTNSNGSGEHWCNTWVVLDRRTEFE
jgi:hypothetical protein